MKLRHFKDGVEAKDLKVVTVEGMLIAAEALRVFNYDLVVTSLSDGKHMGTSLHYSGYAFDVRTRDMKVQDVPTVVRELRKRLGVGWDVVQEADHLHVEYDPH